MGIDSGASSSVSVNNRGSAAMANTYPFSGDWLLLFPDQPMGIRSSFHVGGGGLPEREISFPHHPDNHGNWFPLYSAYTPRGWSQSATVDTPLKVSPCRQFI